MGVSPAGRVRLVSRTEKAGRKLRMWSKRRQPTQRSEGSPLANMTKSVAVGMMTAKTDVKRAVDGMIESEEGPSRVVGAILPAADDGLRAPLSRVNERQFGRAERVQDEEDQSEELLEDEQDPLHRLGAADCLRTPGAERARTPSRWTSRSSSEYTPPEYPVRATARPLSALECSATTCAARSRRYSSLASRTVP